MKKKLELQAYLLFLSTWNFAAFRYVMNSFNLKKFDKKLKGIEPMYKKLKKLNFKTIDLEKRGGEIKKIYNILASMEGVRETGAPKLMHLKKPELFVMWDSYIREHYGFRKGTNDDYLNFLKLMQKKFKNQKAFSGVTLTRTIDLINMRRITLPILKKVREDREEIKKNRSDN